jgi:hypothetical protein
MNNQNSNQSSQKNPETTHRDKNGDYNKNQKSPRDPRKPEERPDNTQVRYKGNV